MILLSSLIFAFLFYVIPLELLLVALAKMLGDWRLTETLWLVALNVVAYVAILFVVRASKGAYEFFEGPREAHYKKLKGYLDLRGSRWMNLYGVVLVGGGAAFFFYQGLLPIPFWFLFGAIVLGLFDVFYKDQLFIWKRPLPDPLDLDDLKKREKPLSDDISLSFKWHFKPLPTMGESKKYAETFRFLKTDYESACKIERHDQIDRNNRDYPRYIHDGLTTDVQILAHWFRTQSDVQELSPLAEVENVVTFVRSIRYETDQVTHGVSHYSNYPIETLVESPQGSDCEDHAILAAALLHHLGHQVALFWIELEDSAHLALGYGGLDSVQGFGGTAKSGEYYAYYETVPTSRSNRFGDISSKWLSELKRAEVWEI